MLRFFHSGPRGLGLRMDILRQGKSCQVLKLHTIFLESYLLLVS